MRGSFHLRIFPGWGKISEAEEEAEEGEEREDEGVGEGEERTHVDVGERGAVEDELLLNSSIFELRDLVAERDGIGEHGEGGQATSKQAGVGVILTGGDELNLQPREEAANYKGKWRS